MNNSFLKSLSYAINGLKLSLAEKHIRIHAVLAIVAIASGFIFSISSLEWCMILLCICAVIAIEIINTAIEKLADLIEPNINPKVAVIKDLSAGAVLFASIISVIIACLIFGKYILALL